MENEKCKALYIESSDKPIFGLVTKDTEDYFVFKTGSNREYTISKHAYFLLKPTNIDFKPRGVEQ